MLRNIAVGLVTFIALTPLAETRLYGQRQLSPAERGEREERVRQQQDNRAGIFVEPAKVYDDAMLLQMLRAAEARLATIQAIDQAGITSRIGAVSGATQRVSSFGLNVQTPQIPGVTSVDKSGSAVTTDSDTDNFGADGKPTTSTNLLSTVTTGSSRDVTTTGSAFGPPTASAPAPSTTMPTSFSVSASDALNEMMQVTYEIANLRLLLEGAVSDQVMVKNAGRPNEAKYIKPRVTLGFPITIASDHYEDAVAVVEVEVQKKGDVVGNLLPTVTALLPREKSYNVAAITDSSMSIGAGVATSMVGVSGSFLTGRKTYYITQDQDTVAMTFQPSDAGSVGFRWEFRPVLGKRHVRPGLKQTFVQLAFPAELSEDELGTMTVRTYWLKYDRKNGRTKQLVKGSYSEYDSRPVVRGRVASSLLNFSSADLQDLGGGQMFVNVPGRFLAGALLRLGSTMLRDGDGVRFDPFAAKFTASIADLAVRRVAIVGRDGTEEPLLMVAAADAQKERIPLSAEAQVAGLDDGNVTLTVTLDRDVSGLEPPPVVIVGSRVFGYSDGPLTRNKTKLTATVPMSLLLANQQITVTSLFLNYRLTAPVQGLTALSRAERLVLLEQGQTSSRFLLYGNRLRDLAVIEPSGTTLTAIGRPEDADTLKLLTIPGGGLKSHKQLLLQRANERPFLVAMPPGERAPAMKARERVVVNADEATFDLDTPVESVLGAEWRKKKLAFERLDARTVRVSGLRAAGVTAIAASESIEITFPAGKATGTIETVTQKVESLPHQPGKQ